MRLLEANYDIVFTLAQCRNQISHCRGENKKNTPTRPVTSSRRLWGAGTLHGVKWLFLTLGFVTSNTPARNFLKTNGHHKPHKKIRRVERREPSHAGGGGTVVLAENHAEGDSR